MGCCPVSGKSAAQKSKLYDGIMRMEKNFARKVNKAAIPVCNIMGVDIAAINMDWLLSFTRENIRDLSGDYMCVSNVHTTVMSYDDPAYCAIQNGGIMAIPDGGPLSSIGRKRGFQNMARTTGPSYLEEVLKISAEHGWSHYFYGSTEETLSKLRKMLAQRYPDVQVAGMYSPPFRSMTADEDEAIIAQINACEADFVWVGLGAPKQEIWMADHQNCVSGLMVGVGAAFDYLAGNISRAPQWMQDCNLEWLYRLLQDPKRLFKRYMATNVKFIWHAVLRGK